MLNKNEITNNIYELKKYGEKRLSKYYRNYRKYGNTPYVDLRNVKDPDIIGFLSNDYSGEDDTSASPNINIIKSCIDTLVSKISQQKVRPFFSTINGTFNDIKICKQQQHYFDQTFDELGVNKTVSDQFRDACLFDTGCIYVNPDNGTINRQFPWQVYILPAERQYGKLTRCYIEQKDYPVQLLPDAIRDKVTKSYHYVTYGVYYDTYNKCKAYYIPEISTTITSSEFESDMVPVIMLYYSSPVTGTSSLSIVDQLNDIQTEINILMDKIKTASQLNPQNTIVLPEGSNIKAEQVNNRIGNVLTYRQAPGVTTPVSVMTPQFLNEQYMKTVQILKEQAYEIVGISQLSAQSSKPSGLNSGVALTTMEDIESDRFETQLNQVIRAYVDITRVCINVFPQGDKILPTDRMRQNITWNDILKESKKMTIQYSGASALSKDPSTKIQQIQTLAQQGLIPQSKVAQLLDIPDLENAYGLANNQIDAVSEIIDECINKKDFDPNQIPDYVPYNMLKDEIISTQLSLRASGKDNSEEIGKLDELFQQIYQKEQDQQHAMQMNTVMNQQKAQDMTMQIQQNTTNNGYQSQQAQTAGQAQNTQTNDTNIMSGPNQTDTSQTQQQQNQ